MKKSSKRNKPFFSCGLKRKMKRIDISKNGVKKSFSRIASSLSKDSLKLIMIIVLSVVLICSVFSLTAGRRAANSETAVKDAFSRIVKSADYLPVSGDYLLEGKDSSVKKVYQAETDGMIDAYCMVATVHGEESFDLAVCIDPYTSVIKGVSVISGTLSTGHGTHGLWLESGYLDLYKDMNGSNVYAELPLLDNAPRTSQAVKSAVLECLDIALIFDDGGID